MSHTITIPDELYHAIEEYAARRGETAEAAILAWAERIAQHAANAAQMEDADVDEYVNDPRYDPWAGFRGVAEARSADSVDQHDEYLAEDALAAHEPE